MSNVKMSDVFDLPVKSKNYDLFDAKGINDDGSAVFNCTRSAYFASHAINLHDALVAKVAEQQAEIERLREVLSSVDNELMKIETKSLETPNRIKSANKNVDFSSGRNEEIMIDITDISSEIYHDLMGVRCTI